MQEPATGAGLQFGVTVHAAGSAAAYRQTVERAEHLGFDVIAAPDHLGALAPFTSLAAAAAISSTVRLRTYVLNTGFWNPALLAREVATLDLLSGGRVDLGLGAGHAAAEFERARLPWLGFDDRVRRLADTVEQVRDLLDDESHQPRPVQTPVPMMVGGASRAALDLARIHADIVGVSGLLQVPEAAPGTFTLMSSTQAAERVGFVREVARPGRRFDFLLQTVAVGAPPEASADEMVRRTGKMTTEQVLDSPFVLLASTPEDAADELERRRRLYGFDSVTVLQKDLEQAGAVIAAFRTVGVDGRGEVSARGAG